MSDEKIRIGIAGYGNLGRGVEAAVAATNDMTLRGVWTRRDPDTVTPANPDTTVRAWASLAEHRDTIDVLILCGGSKSDLPEQSPELAAQFNIVDSFDTHADIPAQFARVDPAARTGGTTALISSGWDPGVFSINRIMGEAILPRGETYTFWGRGVSQGHSDAVRRVEGVADGVQYTIPAPEAIDQVRSGSLPELTTRQKHTRDCYVVLAEGADPEQVRESILTMENYFADYDTTVTFVTAEELARDHSGMPHGGFVLRSGQTGDGHSQTVEYGLRLGSNPEFTASVLVAYARAVHRLHRQGVTGALTVFDIAPGLLSPKTAQQLRAEDL